MKKKKQIVKTKYIIRTLHFEPFVMYYEFIIITILLYPRDTTLFSLYKVTRRVLTTKVLHSNLVSCKFLPFGQNTKMHEKDVAASSIMSKVHLRPNLLSNNGIENTTPISIVAP